jgi:hypothetical protein
LEKGTIVLTSILMNQREMFQILSLLEKKRWKI